MSVSLEVIKIAVTTLDASWGWGTGDESVSRTVRICLFVLSLLVNVTSSTV